MFIKKIFLLALTVSALHGYNQPFLYQGFYSMLAGMPGPDGGRLEQGFLAYNANKFTNNNGDSLGCQSSPHFNYELGWTALGYQSPKARLFKGRPGFFVAQPYYFNEDVERNSLGLTDNGNGFSDIYAGAYMQWDPIYRNDNPLFAHRLTFNVNFPTGKFNGCRSYNPGNGVYYINPSWAATLFLTNRWSLSTNLYYIWSTKKKHTNNQPGQAFFLNYSTEYKVREHMYVALNGYFLQQFTDEIANCVSVPCKRESVFSVGPGFLFKPREKIDFLLYAYFEQFAKNRPQGINFFARLVWNF